MPNSNRMHLGVNNWMRVRYFTKDKFHKIFHLKKIFNIQLTFDNPQQSRKKRLESIYSRYFSLTPGAKQSSMTLQVALAFVQALQLSFGLTSDNILLALQEAHRAADEYYYIRHAMEWDTTFLIPAEAIAADSKFFRDCQYDFSKMCRYKQDKLASNRLSVARIIDLFGEDGRKNSRRWSSRCANLVGFCTKRNHPARHRLFPARKIQRSPPKCRRRLMPPLMSLFCILCNYVTQRVIYLI